VTFVVGIALVVALVAVVLTRSPPRLVSGGTPTEGLLGSAASSFESCQAGEVIPAGTSAIRLSLETYLGAKVRVTAYSGTRVLAQGRRGPEWTGTSVTVPIKPLGYTASNVKLCIAVGPNSQPVFIQGSQAPRLDAAVVNGEPIDGRVGVEYLASGQGSWWTRILTVARHMGLGHALSGTWVVLLIAALVAGCGLLAVGLTLGELP
jgi:hypothetical protein